jgi:mRNA interferase MazF
MNPTENPAKAASSETPNPFPRGALFWADLDPVTGSEAAMTRPVLIVSRDANNKGAATVTVLPLSSSVHKLYSFEVYIEHQQLPKPSKIQAQHIRTIDKTRLGGYIGTVSTADLELVEYAIKLHLDLG